VIVAAIFVDIPLREFRTAKVNLSAQSPRAELSRTLLQNHGKHVVLVCYSPEHKIENEYVFNGADIDASPIIWARDMGDEKNRELLDYYGARKFWLWQPDLREDAIAPYQPTTSK
jgi:hypothetical protein